MHRVDSQQQHRDPQQAAAPPGKSCHASHACSGSAAHPKITDSERSTSGDGAAPQPDPAVQQRVIERRVNVARGQVEHARQRFGGEVDAVALIPPERLPVKPQRAQHAPRRQ
jgi:hypothetical protein